MPGVAVVVADDDCDVELQGECQEQQKCGRYDQYHNFLRQLEQRQVASRIAGLQITALLIRKTCIAHLATLLCDPVLL